MDRNEFEKYLKKGGRSPSAIQRCIRMVGEFQEYLMMHRARGSLDETTPADLEEFVNWFERQPKTSAKTHLWALGYYFDFAAVHELRDLVAKLRQERITRKPFSLKDFRGINEVYAERLASNGIVDVAQMIEVGSTPVKRQALSKKTGIPLDVILEFVKLSDLARISGLKAIRARLYYDAGVDTIEKLARWVPEDLRAMMIEFVERTGFDGIPPLPKEAKNAVETAQKLPKVVVYE